MEGGGGIQRRARQQQTFWSYQGCLVTTANYLQGRETDCRVRERQRDCKGEGGSCRKRMCKGE